MDCNNGISKISYRDFSLRLHQEIISQRLPIDGTIEITLRCNLGCLHCYCCHDPQKKELNTLQIHRIIDEIVDAGCLWLLITGGEPLLRSDFIDIYAYAKKKGLLITLFTNATLLNAYIADYLADYPPFSIEVSLYGVTEFTYEKITGTQGSFKECVEGIGLIKERGLPLKIKTMLLTMNEHELEKIKKFAESLKTDFRFDPTLSPRLDGSKKPYQFMLTPERILKFEMEDADRARGWREFCASFPEPENSDLLFNCGAGIFTFHIDPYGILNACIICRFLSYDLVNGSFKEGWNSFIPENILTLKQKKDSRCSACNLRYLCDLCPGWSYLEHGRLEKTPVERLCKIAKLRDNVFGPVKIKNEKEVMFR